MQDNISLDNTLDTENLDQSNELINPNVSILEPQITASIKIPPFYNKRPELWFLQIETQFRLKHISHSQTKFDHLISALPAEQMEVVSDILLNPPDSGDAYEIVKNLLITRSQDTEERRLDSLLNKMELGDQKPSELYRQMELLAGTNSLVNTKLLNKLWLNKLPPTIQSCMIALEGTQQPDKLFTIADRIFDSSPSSFSRISSIKNETQQSELATQLEHISRKLENLEAQLNQYRTRSRSISNHRFSQHNSTNHFNRSSSKNRTNSKSQPNRSDVSTEPQQTNESNQNNMCHYHRRFAERARKCLAGCTYFSNKTSSKN